MENFDVIYTTIGVTKRQNHVGTVLGSHIVLFLTNYGKPFWHEGANT